MYCCFAQISVGLELNSSPVPTLYHLPHVHKHLYINCILFTQLTNLHLGPHQAGFVPSGVPIVSLALLIITQLPIL